MSARFTQGPGRRARLVALAVLASLVAAAVVIAAPPTPAVQADPVASGHLDWGVKASFRTYITGPIAHGAVALADGATTNGDGTYRFPAEAGGDVTGPSIDASFGGSVHFTGHDYGTGPVLDLLISDVRVEASAEAAVLVADVVSRPYVGGTTPQPPVTYDDVELATLDLSSVTPTVSGTTSTWTAVPAALTEAGSPAFAGFYPAGTALDPVTFSLTTAEAPTWEPQIAVSKTTGIDPAGETVTVTGSGFDPAANTGTRPPLAGQKAGVYVVFGRVAETWRPSEGAASSTRQVISQRWAIPASSMAIVNPAGTNPQYVLLEEDGTFTTTLDIHPADGTGAYGVFTYAGSGATNADQELFTPIAFAQPGGIEGTVEGAGEPVADVCAYLYEGYDTGYTGQAYCTGADGGYAFTGVDPGSYHVAVSDPQGVWATAWQEVVVPDGGVADGDIALDLAASLAGRVVDAGTGEGVEACVYLYDGAGEPAPHATCTRPDGFYTFGLLPAGEYKVGVASVAPYHRTWWSGGGTDVASAGLVEVVDGAPTAVDASLTGVARVALAPVGPGDAPVAGACLYLYDGDATDLATADAVAGTCAGPSEVELALFVAPGTYKLAVFDPAGAHVTTWVGGSTIAAATPTALGAGPHDLGTLALPAVAP